MSIAAIIAAINQDWVVQMKTNTGVRFAETIKAPSKEEAISRAKRRYSGVFITDCYRV